MKSEYLKQIFDAIGGASSTVGAFLSVGIPQGAGVCGVGVPRGGQA